MRHIAIKNIYPDTRMINGESDVRDINDLAIEIDEDLIQQELVKLQAEYDAHENERNRQAEYPALAEQLDEIYHNGIDSWKAIIKVTKDKYPKG